MYFSNGAHKLFLYNCDIEHNIFFLKIRYFVKKISSSWDWFLSSVLQTNPHYSDKLCANMCDPACMGKHSSPFDYPGSPRLRGSIQGASWYNGDCLPGLLVWIKDTASRGCVINESRKNTKVWQIDIFVNMHAWVLQNCQFGSSDIRY